jgi:hypothetical protein
MPFVALWSGAAPGSYCREVRACQTMLPGRGFFIFLLCVFLSNSNRLLNQEVFEILSRLYRQSPLPGSAVPLAIAIPAA